MYAPNSNGILGDVTRAVSPQVAYNIGQYFKQNKTLNQLDNGNRPEEQSLQHLLAHTILGAAVSYATGNNPITGALSGAGSEAVTPILSDFLFGKKPNELSQDEKDTITSILSLTTVTTAYTTTGGSVADAVNGAEVGRVGVENNANIFVNGHWNRLLFRVNAAPSGPGKEQYWDYFDAEFIPEAKEFLNSQAEKDIFVDGSSFMGIDQDGKDRYRLGYQEVYNNIDKYESLLTSRNETFKIISHSEGGAYGAGMAQALIDKGYKVETMLSLSPDEASDYSVPSQPMVYQIHNRFDVVSPFAIPNNTDYVLILQNNKNPTTTHTQSVTKDSVQKIKLYLNRLGQKSSHEEKKIKIIRFRK